ncbi:hypothetical protein [Methylobacterium sp. SD21]|uniref:hypothetical protein n=1 Tax=Methylobacterium litchii TaxID=3138810 RepID=UPI00313C8049
MPRLAAAFDLQFPLEQIEHWASRYAYRDDAEAMVAGQFIAGGEHTRAHLLTIHRWKTKGRGRSRIACNSDAEIADALALAIAARTDRAAAAVLCGLVGVQFPVASAILTTIDPERYTIIDFRALEALGASKSYVDMQLFLEYLNYCRGLAADRGVSLRTLDRALWQWSAENGTPEPPEDASAAMQL